MKKFHITLALWALAMGMAFAHNTDEISYFIKLDSKELIIHLTPKSAVDLLKNIHPRLNESTTINLLEYSDDFEIYFNDRLDLTISEVPARFELIDLDLASHDASFRFKLENIPKHPKIYQIKVESFLDIYQKGKNYVFLSANGQKHRYVLNNQKTEVHGAFKNISNQDSNQGKTALYLSLAFASLSIGFTIYRKANFGLNHYPKPKS
ncbi:DUF6702 family protein [Flagellimonas nanhaiensis]|nr:DUF6702 family protein [Allomuricauda nanhaiensis]